MVLGCHSSACDLSAWRKGVEGDRGKGKAVTRTPHLRRLQSGKAHCIGTLGPGEIDKGWMGGRTWWESPSASELLVTAKMGWTGSREITGQAPPFRDPCWMLTTHLLLASQHATLWGRLQERSTNPSTVILPASLAPCGMPIIPLLPPMANIKSITQPGQPAGLLAVCESCGPGNTVWSTCIGQCSHADGQEGAPPIFFSFRLEIFLLFIRPSSRRTSFTVCQTDAVANGGTTLTLDARGS